MNYGTKRKLAMFLVVAIILAMFLAYVDVRSAGASEVEKVVVKPQALGGFSLMWQEFTESKRTLYDEEDLHVLSAVMQLENGDANDRCLLLTGSVLLNRVKYCTWCPNTLRGCVLQGYKDKSIPQQYATKTVVNLDTVKVSDRVRRLAIQLLMFGSISPPTVIYQAQFMQGSGLYDEIDGEYFCYE